MRTGVANLRYTEAISGALVKVSIYAESAAVLMGYQFDLRYDPNVLELLTVEAGEAFHSPVEGGEGAYFKSPKIDAVDGRAKHIAAMRFSQSWQSATGEIAVATFRRRAAADVSLNGQSRIEITNIKIAGPNGNPIPVHFQHVMERRINTPQEVRFALGQNYPNPFNPETWIPFQLAEPANITIQIYDLVGVRIRTLELGHLPAGDYLSRDRAAHWDGLNAQGEPVASGIYFYELRAGEFTAKRKMLIRK